MALSFFKGRLGAPLSVMIHLKKENHMQTNEKTGATYTTQMDAARKGIITPQMQIVAKKEKNA